MLATSFAVMIGSRSMIRQIPLPTRSRARRGGGGGERDEQVVAVPVLRRQLAAAGVGALAARRDVGVLGEEQRLLARAPRRIRASGPGRDARRGSGSSRRRSPCAKSSVRSARACARGTDMRRPGSAHVPTSHQRSEDRMAHHSASFSLTLRVHLDDQRRQLRRSRARDRRRRRPARRDRPRARRRGLQDARRQRARDRRRARAARSSRPASNVDGVEVEHVSDRTFLLHLGGKIEMESKAPVKTRDDLSMAYTPGVARVCRAIAEDPESVWNLTIKRNTVAVVTDGSAVLGLGDIGPAAAMPVMEGKALLFKEFGGVDAWPICLDTKDTDRIVATVEAIAPGFGGINLEDIAAPRCFEVEERLRGLARHPGLPRRPARHRGRRARRVPQRAARRRQAHRGRQGRRHRRRRRRRRRDQDAPGGRRAQRHRRRQPGHDPPRPRRAHRRSSSATRRRPTRRSSPAAPTTRSPAPTCSSASRSRAP